MENELPNGWILSQLKDVGDVVTGNTPPKKEIEHFGGNIPWIKPGDLLDRKIIKFEETLTESGASIARLLPPNSVMVSCIGNLGKIGIIDRPATTNQQINSVVFNSSIVNPFFGFYYALTLKEWLYENSSATTVSIINKGRFEKAPIPVPPLPEQQRIVAKLDTLFGHLDALKTRLDRIPQLLKDFRQKVLTQAVTGKLTEEWREGRELENEYDPDFLANMRDTTIEIPDLWYWLPFECIATIKSNLVDPNKYLEYPLIAPDNIQSETGLLISKPLVSDIMPISSKHIFEKGSIVYSKIRPYLSKLVIADFDGLCSADMYPISSDLETRYLFYYMLSEHFLSYATTAGERTVLPKINQKGLNEIPVPVPPREEQQEIVRRVESLFAKADHIEASYQKLKAKIEQLPQALLAKAFRGELVEQLPNDGDARELLEQIKKLKEEGEGKGRGKKLKVEEELNVAAEPKGKYGKIN